MDYHGKYHIFDAARISTYPVASRRNRVTVESLLNPEQVLSTTYQVNAVTEKKISEVAEHLSTTAKAGRPVIIFIGAHLVKNGLGLLIVDLMKRGVITVVASNTAGAIHDFELALTGETSEDVPNALPHGQFGMAYEFSYINEAIRLGNEMKLGFGESLGRMIEDKDFRERVLNKVARQDPPLTFQHPDKSILATGYRLNVPVTIHVTIGTDVIDQHANFDGAAKGGTRGCDFMMFVDAVTKMTLGGVVLNIGSAVTGPEVLLKAVSMSANVGCPPQGIITADFDLRPYDALSMGNEDSLFYYYRDQKSVVTRIPRSFGGKGYYIQGDQRVTVPLLYQKIIKSITS
jgi:hypothetical protein